MRTESEIVPAEQEFFDRVWHERHLLFRGRYEAGDPGRATEEIYQQALTAAEQVKARTPTYGRSRVTSSGHVERQALGSPLGAG
jgi:hypothetical protein